MHFECIHKQYDIITIRFRKKNFHIRHNEYENRIF